METHVFTFIICTFTETQNGKSNSSKKGVSLNWTPVSALFIATYSIKLKPYSLHWK